MSQNQGVNDAPDSSAAPRMQSQVKATPKEWIGLALLVMPMLVTATDLTVLFFAMPTITEALDPTASQALWIVHIYGFLIAGFLITMGRLGDRVGPRRLLLIGGVGFGGLSLLAAFSINAEMLIAIRAALGVAAATLMPSLFSLLRTMFRDEGQRRLAIAILFSSFTVGGAVGPLLGGALLEFFWWGSVFLINVPPMALLVILGVRVLPERTERNRQRLDLASVVLSLAGMLAVVYGLQELAAGQESGEGTTAPYLASAVVGVLVLALFVRRQRRLEHPLFDLALARNPRIGASLVTLLLSGIGGVGLFYLFSQHLQWVIGLSPLHAGLWTLPYIGVNIIGALSAPWLAGRLRPPVVVTLGLTVQVIGAAVLLVPSGSHLTLPVLVTGLTVIGFGSGAAMALLSDLIISNAPESQAGSAAAAQEVGGELGSAVGIAAAGAVSVSVYRISLADSMPAAIPEGAAEAAMQNVHTGMSAAEDLPADGPALAVVVNDAVTAGLQTYAVTAMTLSAAAAVLIAVILVFGNKPPRGTSAAGTLQARRYRPSTPTVDHKEQNNE